MSADAENSREIQRIATVRSCYGEKFAVPRQPGLAPSARGRLVFEPGFRQPEMLRGLEDFSHLWLIFGFHLTDGHPWSPTVRPPRLGGNRRVGVFASRSTFRPNGLGLSVVRLAGIDRDASDAPILRLDGVDLVDGTPVYDVKPYLPYADALPDASPGYAPADWPRLEVRGVEKLAALDEGDRRAVVESLALDPRPATGRDEREFGAALCGRNIRFRVVGGTCEILEAGKGEGKGVGKGEGSE